MLTFPDPLAPEDSDELIWENLPSDTEVDIDGEYTFSVHGAESVVSFANARQPLEGFADSFITVPTISVAQKIITTAPKVRVITDIPGTHKITFTAAGFEPREFIVEAE